MNTVSYSLFRHGASAYESERCGESQGRFFAGFLPALVRAQLAVWPDWQFRIYHDERVKEFPYWKTLVNLHAMRLLELIPMGEAKTLCGSMMWRLEPLFDYDVQYLVCRDVDACPMPRDKKMVTQFVEAGGAVHAILDGDSHSGPLMGGMIAFDCDKFRRRFAPIKSVAELIKYGDGLGIDYNQHGADQRFLNGVVYPNLCTETVIHSKVPVPEYTAKAKFPVAQREGPADRLANFIGACYGAEDARLWYDANLPNADILKAEA